jgi:hypothetical protein
MVASGLLKPVLDDSVPKQQSELEAASLQVLHSYCIQQGLMALPGRTNYFSGEGRATSPPPLTHTHTHTRLLGPPVPVPNVVIVYRTLAYPGIVLA